jgi:iron complex outermembrane receptor protein
MRLLLNTLLLLAITHLQAQHSIKGLVKDAQTNQELAFANVYITDLEKGTSTDEHGLFQIDNIPPGKHTMQISILGYETQSINILTPHSTDYTILLMPSAIEMEGVIISTPFHKLQSENVMKVEQETIKNLRANGAINLADGITNIAGVESVTTGVSIGKPVIRGLSSNRVLVYTQGVRLENQQFGSEHGLGISDNGIESVEVIKGPASLLYGSDALGGVLYLNPERFAANNTSAGDFGVNYFSNTNGYNTNLGYKASADHFKFLIRGSVSEHADYKTKDYRVTNTRFRDQDFKAGLGYQNHTFKTEFRYNMNHSKLGIPEGIGEQSRRKAPLTPFQDITNHVLSSKSTFYFNNSKLDINLGYVYNDRKEFEDHHHHDDDDHDHEHDHDEEEHHHDEDALEAALHMKLKTANYDIKYHLPTLGKFETIVGIQGMNQVNTNYGEEFLIPDATTNDFGVLGVSHIHFENTDLQLGVRYDNRNIDILSGIQKNYTSFNGAAGMKTHLFSNLTARINVSTGFRAPNLAELTSNGTHHGTNRYEIGNMDLKNEQNFQSDLNIEFKNEHVEFFVNGFYNEVNNYIFLSPDGTFIGGNPVFVYLQEDATLYGGEIGLHIHPHPIHWLHIESSFETVTGKDSNKNYLPLIPANSISTVLRVEFENSYLNKSQAFVKWKSTFAQNNVGLFETTSDAYNLLSAGLSGSFNLFNKEATMTISGTNLTNVKYINHLSRLKSDGIFNMGRNINIGITYQL